MEAKWNIANPADQEKVGALALALGMDRELAELLVQRGIDTSNRPAHSSGRTSRTSTTPSS